MRCSIAKGSDPAGPTPAPTETAALAARTSVRCSASGPGRRVSIDDYGTGLTLEYLKKIPASEIKVDQASSNRCHHRSDLVMV